MTHNVKKESMAMAKAVKDKANPAMKAMKDGGKAAKDSLKDGGKIAKKAAKASYRNVRSMFKEGRGRRLGRTTAAHKVHHLPQPLVAP